MHNAFAATKCHQFRAWLTQQAPSVNDACREGEVFLAMRIDERIREEKNGKRDDYQHDDRHGVQRLSRLFDKNPVRALDILRSHAYSHVNAQTTAVEVVDDRAEPGRPVVLAWIDYARIFLRDLTHAKWNPGLFESAANRLRLVNEDSVPQNRNVLLIQVWHLPLLSMK